MNQTYKEYAEALFSLACETNEERAYGEALQMTADLLKENEGYMELLSCPGIPLEERCASIDTVFTGRVPEYFPPFLKLMCERRHLDELDGCAYAYMQLLHVRENTTEAVVTGAVALTEEEKAHLKEKLEKKSGQNVILTCKVDPAILGGLIVEMNGRVLDGSVRHQLNEVKDVISR